MSADPTEKWAADMNRATLKKLRGKYLVALEVVEAARATGAWCFASLMTADGSGCGKCAACRLRAALAAFDEVTV